MLRHASVWIVVLGLVGGGRAFGDTIHVPLDYPTIQEAIDAASDGCEIVVARGTYNESIDFHCKAIRVQSSHGPVVTRIDGDGTDDSVVKFLCGEGADSFLVGFTITGGRPSAQRGGGIRCMGSSPTVLDCRIVDNVGWDDGGGMYNEDSSPTIVNCTFRNNDSDGGGIYNMRSNPLVINCQFSDNGPSSGINQVGGGMLNHDSSPFVVNCTFSRNFARDGGGGVYNIGGAPAFTNCIIWDNDGGSFGGDDVATVTYSDVQGGFPGEGNIDEDPRFVTAHGRFRLRAGSPCIDAGDNTAFLEAAWPLGLGGDLEGNGRFANRPHAPDTGKGIGPIVDMGAYETPSLDLNADLAVDLLDFALFAEGFTSP